VPPEVKGVAVLDVQANSRAVLAGLTAGDVVARIDGTAIASLVDMYALTTKLDVVRPLQVDFLRAGRPMTVIVPPPQGVTPMPQTAGPNTTVPTTAAQLTGVGVGWAGARSNPACPNCTTAP
jgi:predicted metalloprotease with PDZ domain